MGRGFDPHGAYQEQNLTLASGVFVFSPVCARSARCRDLESAIMFPIITQRLNIAPLTMTDLEAFVRYRQDPQVARFQSWEPTYSLAQGAALIQSQPVQGFPETDEWLQIGIRLISSGELVGDLSLHTLEQAGHFELGFTLAREHQGKGYAQEAAGALLEKLFSEQGALFVSADTDSRNIPSQALLTKLGFVKRPEKGWVEEFKGETVTVERYELSRPAE